MYTIKSVDIENNVLVSRVGLQMSDGSEVEVCVPVKLPQDKEEVLAAIEYRERLENEKYDAAPVLNAIKDELDAKYTGKISTEFAKVP